MRANAERSRVQPQWLLIVCCVVFTSCIPEDHATELAKDEAPVTTMTGSKVLVAVLPDGHGRALVALQPRAEHNTRPPTAVVLIDQFGYTFDPPMSIARQGQPVRFRNSEDVDHNVRVSHAETLAVIINTNLMMDESIEHIFVEPGPYTVRCDIHPAMMALILVVSHPYATVTNNAGEFRIDGIPPGSYDLRAWSVGGKPVVELAVQVRAPGNGTELELRTLK